jgi:uncharacterized OsmC-like protein
MARVHLNGVDIEKIQALVKEMQDNPETYKEMASSGWKTRSQWVGGFQHSVYARELPPTTLDEPADIAGGDRGLSPHEAILSSVGACVATGFVAQATVRGVKVDSLEVSVDGSLNLPVFFGLAEGNPGYDSMNITVYAKTDASSEVLQEIYNIAVSKSPVLNTVQRPVNVNTTLRTVE